MPDPATVAEHLWHLWPEMFGGFVAFFVHTIHHRIFKAVLGLLTRLKERG